MMGQINTKLRRAASDDGLDERLAFWCPGCERLHQVQIKGRDPWQFDGALDCPTFSPSIKVTYRHSKGHSNENPAPVDYRGEYVEDVCHFFIRAGRIEFQSDCTHNLAGQTVAIPDLPETWRD
jgi:hypothetical protein